jgi:hypothetical protein
MFDAGVARRLCSRRNVQNHQETRMSPGLQVFLSGTLTFGVPLVVAVREIVVTKRGGGWRPERLPEQRPTKPLPPCLIPPPRPRGPLADIPRSRVLEDA